MEDPITPIEVSEYFINTKTAKFPISAYSAFITQMLTLAQMEKFIDRKILNIEYVNVFAMLTVQLSAGNLEGLRRQVQDIRDLIDSLDDNGGDVY
jgi:hypothetical protein